jgi:hypothetical protein
MLPGSKRRSICIGNRLFLLLLIITICIGITAQVLEISENHQSVYLARDTIEDKLRDDLAKNRVTYTLLDFPFICSPLSFVLKDNNILCRIYNLLYPRYNLIKNSITSEKAYLKYIIITNI